MRSAVGTIVSSRAWREGNGAIFVVADESDYDGTVENGGWADPSGYCDSPEAISGARYVHALSVQWCRWVRIRETPAGTSA